VGGGEAKGKCFCSTTEIHNQLYGILAAAEKMQAQVSGPTVSLECSSRFLLLTYAHQTEKNGRLDTLDRKSNHKKSPDFYRQTQESESRDREIPKDTILNPHL
jgi:hypothetical protein